MRRTLFFPFGIHENEFFTVLINIVSIVTGGRRKITLDVVYLAFHSDRWIIFKIEQLLGNCWCQERYPNAFHLSTECSKNQLTYSSTYTFFKKFQWGFSIFPSYKCKINILIKLLWICTFENPRFIKQKKSLSQKYFKTSERTYLNYLDQFQSGFFRALLDGPKCRPNQNIVIS